MPSSPFLYHSGFGVIAALAVIALVASFLTVIVSTLLLWLYRRTVARLMLAQAGEEPRIVGGTRSEGVSLRALKDSDSAKAKSTSLLDDNDLSDRLYRLANLERRRHAYKYVIAGALFTLVTGLSAVFALSQIQINYLRAADHPFQFLFMFWTCGWPVVLTTNMLAGNRRSQRNRVLGYFAVLIALGALIALTPTEPSFQTGNLTLPAWSGESPLRLAHKWSLFNCAPTLLILMFRHRRVRAVAPLVLSFMTVVSAGVLGIIAAAFVYRETSVMAIVFVAEALGSSVRAALIGYFLSIIAVAGLLCGVLGWRLLVWIRNGYQRKSVNDQSLAIDALWLIFASFYAVMLALGGPGWALSVLVAFFIFKIAVHAGNKTLQSQRQNPCAEPALLVLRVFSLGKRSESLFDAVTKHWRYVGNVRLIAGTDLALSTVAPHQFLAFVSGKLNRLFVRGQTTLERGLAELDTRRDADGRFRINDFFCHADTWQSVLLRLVKSTDVVLMDLRNFTQNNAGCVFEIKELLNTVPLERLVFIVDATTDKAFLDRVLDESYRDLPIGSPNQGVPLSLLDPVNVRSLGDGELHSLLKKLCTAGAGESRLA